MANESSEEWLETSLRSVSILKLPFHSSAPCLSRSTPLSFAFRHPVSAVLGCELWSILRTCLYQAHVLLATWLLIVSMPFLLLISWLVMRRILLNITVVVYIQQKHQNT